MRNRTLQEARTSLAPSDVLAAATRYFVNRNSLYPAFPDKHGATFATFRGQGGEELIIGVESEAGATRVTGSTYLFDQQLARFFTTLPAAEAVT